MIVGGGTDRTFALHVGTPEPGRDTLVAQVAEGTGELGEKVDLLPPDEGAGDETPSLDVTRDGVAVVATLTGGGGPQTLRVIGYR